MLGPNELPFAAVGERCLIKADPAKRFSAGGLALPAESLLRPFSGQIIDAGLQARDKLYDNGLAVGHRVFYGKFAGVIEEWDHVIEGDHTLPDDQYEWRRIPSEPDQPTKYKCDKTGAIRVIQPLVLINVDDILGSEDLSHLLATGALRYEFGRTEDGRTQHVLERNV